MVSSSWFLVVALGILSASAEHHISGGGGEPGAKVLCSLDLGLMIDQTRSLGEENLPTLREAVKEFVREFVIGPSDTHVSLASFANWSTLYNKFNDAAYYSEPALLHLIDSSLTNLSSPTRLDRALSGADKDQFSSESGMRPGFPSAMVLLSDGKTNGKTNDSIITASVNSLKARGVKIIAIAYGPQSAKAENQENLKKIAGDFFFDVANYSSLEALFENVSALLCPDVCAVDLALVADKTQSIGEENFQLLRGFLFQVSDAMDIAPNATHEAVITFAKTANILNRLDDSQYYSNQAMDMLIQGIDSNLTSPTRTDRALEAVVKLFAVGEGSRSAFQNVMVLFTDGKTNRNSKPFGPIVSDLEDLEVRRIAVGIGKKIVEKELEEIANGSVYIVDNFPDLSNLIVEIVGEICSVDGGFSEWSPYGPCSMTCGSGIEQRTRGCTNPPPHGPYGRDCEGPSVETRACNGPPCNVAPPPPSPVMT